MAEVIHTERLTLKLFDRSPEDYDNVLIAFQEMYKDYTEGELPEIPKTPEEIDRKNEKQRLRGNYAKHPQGQQFFIYLGNEFIGLTNLAHRWSRYPDIGWFIREGYRRQGYATEAAKASLKFWYSTIGVPELFAAIAPGHRPSERVAEEIGLQLNGGIVVQREHGPRQTMNVYMLPGMEAFPESYEVDEKTGPHIN